MSSISKYKNGWLLLLFIMIGIVIGGLISEVTAGVSGLSWLSYGLCSFSPVWEFKK